MQQIIVTGQLVQLHSGILELTEQQANARQHNLINLGEGLYQINKPVQFKRGEEFGYDGELNKELTGSVGTDGPDADGNDADGPDADGNDAATKQPVKAKKAKTDDAIQPL